MNFIRYLALLGTLGLKDLAPELPGVTEFSTNESMGTATSTISSAIYHVLLSTRPTPHAPCNMLY